MRLRLLLFFICIYSLVVGQVSLKPSYYPKYVLIRQVKTDISGGNRPLFQAEINQKDIDKLTEPLRALAEYYSARSGSHCDRDDNCDLTTALGLGKQSSAEHIGILKKWFPDDRKVKKMIEQSCFVGISGANHFSEYSFLHFNQHNDTVIVNYKILFYDKGHGSHFNGHDTVVIKNDHIIFIQPQPE